MPEQQPYIVQNQRTKEDLVFPPGTGEAILQAWYNGDESVRGKGRPHNTIDPLKTLGTELPSTPGMGDDILKTLGQVMEFGGGFAKTTPLALPIGMGVSAMGDLLQGGDANSAAMSAGLTGGGGLLGRLISQGFTAGGLKAGGFKGPAWQTAGDFYNLPPKIPGNPLPARIGQTGRIQREVDRSGKLLAEAQAGKKVNLRPLMGSADDAMIKSPKTTGTHPVSFADDAARQETAVIKEWLVKKGWSRNFVNQMSPGDLRAAATLTEIPMQNFGTIKQVAEETGSAVRKAGQQRQRVVAGAADAEGEVASAMAARARGAQRADNEVAPALDRNARAQRAKAANREAQENASFPNLYDRHGLGVSTLLNSTVGRPTVVSNAGMTLDQLVRALLGGAKLEDPK